MDVREMKEAIEDAERTLSRADNMATDMARLLVGRLRKVENTYWNNTLVALKKELQSFNATSKEWKN